MKKVRNYIMAAISKLDPTRLRTRTVKTEKEKLMKSRARRKAKLRKEIDNE